MKQGKKSALQIGKKLLRAGEAMDGGERFRGMLPAVGKNVDPKQSSPGLSYRSGKSLVLDLANALLDEVVAGNQRFVKLADGLTLVVEDYDEVRRALDLLGHRGVDPGDRSGVPGGEKDSDLGHSAPIMEGPHGEVKAVDPQDPTRTPLGRPLPDLDERPGADEATAAPTANGEGEAA